MTRRTIACGNLLIGALLILSACQSAAPTPPASAAREPAAPAAAPDRADALLIYDADNRHVAEWGFQKVVRFYGLKLAEVDLSSTALTDALLRDEAQRYYPTVYIDAKTLESALDQPALALLKTAIVSGGVNLFVGALQSERASALSALTDGQIIGSAPRQDSRQDYVISTELPDITRELSGVVIRNDGPQQDFGLTLSGRPSHTEVIVSATDDQSQLYPLYARYRSGAGSVYVESGRSDPVIKHNRLEWLYRATRTGDAFKQPWFAQITPLLMFVRGTAGDEAWHRDQDYVNLTLDDPSLRMERFDYQGILKEAILHNFHFTVAMPPEDYAKSERPVIELFRSYPERLSLAQHGNNHDGYEFYRYAVDQTDEFPARPLAAQEADLVEGRTRMEAHARQTGIPYAPVMIFPYNIAPRRTLALLKRYNYQGTINSQDYPIDMERSEAWDAYMYPAELAYSNIAVIGRTGPQKRAYPFNLFIDQPVFMYVHKDFFSDIQAFNGIADAINNAEGDVEWQSIDAIMKHLYLEKRNDDGSIDVMFFGNDLIVSNNADEPRMYHLRRADDGATPIDQLLINGAPSPYTLADGRLAVDALIHAGSARELTVRYGAADRDFTLAADDITVERHGATATIAARVRNAGPAAGPVSAEIFDGQPFAGVSLGIGVAEQIKSGAAAAIQLDQAALSGDQVCVALDPYDVILETDEGNNIACTH
jgi:hypothetical protein